MTSTAEITWLEGIELEDPPGCIARIALEVIALDDPSCGQPSVARVHTKHECGRERTPFLCEGCLRNLKEDYFRCRGCEGIGNYTWSES